MPSRSGTGIRYPMSGISEGFDPPNPDELWRFVALGEHDVPSSGLATRKVRQGLSGFIGRLFRRQSAVSSPLTGEEDLLALSESQAGRFVPEPEGNRGAEAFHDHLGSWLARDQPAKPIIFLVGPLYGGRLEVLEALAAREPFRSVPPPSAGMITAQDHSWFRSWPKKGVWVLPRLEKCFLRRFDGLGLVRKLLVRSLSGELGRGIIGCDPAGRGRFSAMSGPGGRHSPRPCRRWITIVSR